jgi:hypothetical protein
MERKEQNQSELVWKQKVEDDFMKLKLWQHTDWDPQRAFSFIVGPKDLMKKEPK